MYNIYTKEVNDMYSMIGISLAVIISTIFFYLLVFSVLRWIFWRSGQKLSKNAESVLKVFSVIIGLFLYLVLLDFGQKASQNENGISPLVGMMVLAFYFFLVPFGIYCEITLRKVKIIKDNTIKEPSVEQAEWKAALNDEKCPVCGEKPSNVKEQNGIRYFMHTIPGTTYVHKYKER